MSKFGVPTEAQMVKINKHSRRTLSADEVFAFSGKSAGDMMIPGRHIRLSPELLQQFAKDAQFGVSFMYNHSWSQFGAKGIAYGKVFDGRTKPDTENGETMALYLDKYIIRDEEVVDGISANALIKRIETGVLSDTSIGWGTDTMVCSICNTNYFGGKCSHWRGLRYKMADGTTKVCTVLAMPSSVILENSNTNLYEESMAWDGAYPGANLSNDGDVIENPNGKFVVVEEYKNLNPGTVVLGQYCNGTLTTMVKKSDHKKVFAMKGGDIPMDKVKKMLDAFGVNADDPAELEGLDMLSVLAEKWDNMVQHIQESAAPVAMFMTQEQADAALGKEYSAEEVLKFAKEGIEHHTDVIDDAIKWGVRAMGNEFPVKTWKSTFAGMATKQIMDIMRTFEAKAKAEIPAGRMSDPEGGKGQPRRHVPEELYRVGR